MKPELLEQALKDAADLRVFKGLEHMADRITTALETLAAERDRLVAELTLLRAGIERSVWHDILGGRAKRILVAESAIERIDQALASIGERG